ncbi:15189_t:CDS:1 [Funneliformis geosporum]|uniref:15189_t:CDS:1 n=1 Tax=Funneliformis geosporum TaxID=1117311 RepID=A0A9W4SU49_9GLOM|nr:15189_t:CDS:1 [Funneliformis geosporum]
MREIRKQIYENFNQTIKQIEPIEFLNSTAKEQTDKNIEEFKKKLSDHATEIKQLTGFKEELEKIKMLLSMETKQKEELIAKNRELETSYTSETKELNNKIDSLNQYLENTCTELKTRNEAKTKLEEEIERLNERLTFGLDDKEELNSSRRKLVEKNKELETSNQELKLIIQEREKELLLVKQETEKIKENLKNIQNIDTKLKLAEEEATY